VLDKMSSLMTSAFGLVAALAWNTAIQSLFSTLQPGTGAAAQLGYAAVVTVIAVLAVIYISRLANRAKQAATRLHIPHPRF
jgi:TRAP-type C4-dicarboxylate transport system permease small subunit